MKNKTGVTDVFLSHNSKDKSTIRSIAKALEADGIRVWFDEWDLIPGLPWQEELEKGIENSKSVAVFIGSNGLGRWENPEMRAALSEAANRGISVIPVLLPGGPNPSDLPIFLKAYTCVDMRHGADENCLLKLKKGIQRKKVFETRQRRQTVSNDNRDKQLINASIKIEDTEAESYRAPRYFIVADEKYEPKGIILALSISIVNFSDDDITINGWEIEVPKLKIRINKLTPNATIRTFPTGMVGIRKSFDEYGIGKVRIPAHDSVQGILLRFENPIIVGSELENLDVLLWAKIIGKEDIQCNSILKPYEGTWRNQ